MKWPPVHPRIYAHVWIFGKKRRTVGISRPRDNDDARDSRALAEVYHPDGRLDVEVVQHGAAVYAVVHVGTPVQLVLVDYVVVAGRVLMTSSMTLILTSTVDERVLLVGQVLHCTSSSPRSVILRISFICFQAITSAKEVMSLSRSVGLSADVQYVSK